MDSLGVLFVFSGSSGSVSLASGAVEAPQRVSESEGKAEGLVPRAPNR